jgi:hypothetical protein
MALFQSPQVIANKAIPASRDGVGTVAITAEFVVPAGLALNDIIELGGLPAAHIPVDLVVSFPDADSNGTPLIAFDAGLITGRFGDPVLGSRTIGSEFFAADTTARTGGLARANKSLSGIAPVTGEQGWGLKVQAAAATLATGGRIRATLFAVPAPAEVAFA